VAVVVCVRTFFFRLLLRTGGNLRFGIGGRKNEIIDSPYRSGGEMRLRIKVVKRSLAMRVVTCLQCIIPQTSSSLWVNAMVVCCENLRTRTHGGCY